MSRSNVTYFQALLVFTMVHIPTKLHQFPTRSFRDFVRTDRRTDNTKNKTCSQHGWRAGNKPGSESKCSQIDWLQPILWTTFSLKSFILEFRSATSNIKVTRSLPKRVVSTAPGGGGAGRRRHKRWRVLRFTSAKKSLISCCIATVKKTRNSDFSSSAWW